MCVCECVCVHAHTCLSVCLGDRCLEMAGEGGMPKSF